MNRNFLILINFFFIVKIIHCYITNNLSNRLSLLLSSSMTQDEMATDKISTMQKYLNKKINHNIKIIKDKDIADNDTIIAKSLIFDIGPNQYLLLLDQNKYVDIRILSIYFKLNEKKIKLSNRNIAEEISGLKMGTVHPITDMFDIPIPIIIDEELTQHRYFYAGSGHSDYSTCLHVNDIIEISKRQVKIFQISKSDSKVYDNGDKINDSNKNKNDENINDKIKDLKEFNERDININIITLINKLRKVVVTKNVDSYQTLMRQYDNFIDLENIDENANYLDSPSSSGKTLLMLAAWRGSIEIVKDLIRRGCDIDKYSTNSGNYGKTAIFYAITRCRDDVVMQLLHEGSNVKIINNKGQTPLSLSISHLNSSTIEEIETLEKAQYNYNWINFRESHSDGNKYGDLDPRFLEKKTVLEVANSMMLEDSRVLNPTNFRSRYNHVNNIKKKLDNTKRNYSKTLILHNRDLKMDFLNMVSGNEILKVRNEDNDNYLYTLPKPDKDTGLVEVQCKIISKRHIGKTLCFADVLPIDCSNSDDKFCWLVCNKEISEKVALQIIIGKTVKDALGEEKAHTLCVKLKV